jgi:hypothetical protein
MIANSIDGIDKGYNQIDDMLSSTELYTYNYRQKSKEEGKPDTIRKQNLTKEQALRAYALSLNEVQNERLKELGIDETQINEIKDFLGTELVEFADKTVEFLSGEMYESINTVYKDINDINLPYIQNYFPTMSVEDGKQLKARLEPKNFGRQFSVETSSLFKQRSANKKPLDLNVDFTKQLNSYVMESSKYEAYAEAVDVLRSIISDEVVNAQLEVSGLKNKVLSDIDYAINGSRQGAMHYVVEKTLGSVASKFVGFALAYKIMQIPKQASSMIAALDSYKKIAGYESSVVGSTVRFMADLSVVIAKLFAELGFISTNKVFKTDISREGLPFWEAMNMSANFKDRLRKGLEGDLLGLEAGSVGTESIDIFKKKFKRLSKRYKKAAGFTTVAGDILGVIGYMAAYNRAIKQGMSKEKALEIFNDYNATQQSRRATEKIPLQQSSSSLKTFLLMFASTPILQLNKGFQYLTLAARESKNAVKNKDGKAAKKAAVYLRDFYLNTAITNMAFVYAGNFIKLHFGDDEDAEEVYDALIKAATLQTLFTNIPLFGGFNTFILDGWLNDDIKKNTSWYGMVNDPVLDVIKNILANVKYDKMSMTEASLLNFGNLILGANLSDKVLALHDLFSGDFDEESFYDLIGLSWSYQPNRQKSSSDSGGGFKSGSRKGSGKKTTSKKPSRKKGSSRKSSGRK